MKRVVIKVEPRLLGRFEARFARNMRRSRVHKALLAGGKEVKQHLRSASQKVYYRGEYREGWYATIIGPNQMVISNKAPHFPNVEYGRRPNRAWPPHDPILKWVLSKGMGAGAVWPIRRKIGIVGIPGRPLYIKPTVQKNMEKIVQKRMLRFLDEALQMAAK